MDKETSEEKDKEMTADQLRLEDKVVYIDNVPAFVIAENGNKDPMTPTGWNTYRGNQVLVDDWLEFQLRSKRKRVI